MHTGQTTCPACHQVFSAMYPLRRHLRVQHGLDRETVDALTRHGAAGDQETVGDLTRQGAAGGCQVADDVDDTVSEGVVP